MTETALALGGIDCQDQGTALAQLAGGTWAVFQSLAARLLHLRQTGDPAVLAYLQDLAEEITPRPAAAEERA